MGIKQNTQQEKQNVSKSKTSGAVEKTAQKNSKGFVERFKSYLEASYAELGKVSWPTWKEVKATGFAVAALVVIMSLFLGVVDFFLSSTIASILSLGS